MGFIKEVLKKYLRRIKYFHKNDNTLFNNNFNNTIKVKGSAIKGNSIDVKNDVKIKYSEINGDISIGQNSVINKSKIVGKVILDENCKIHQCHLEGTIKIGKFSSLFGPNLDVITGNYKVEIGNFCSIARNVSMQVFNHNHNKITSYFIGQNVFNEVWDNEKISKGNLIIENDVWIGAHSVILGGLIIHNGAVIAANSVVTKDVPAYAVVAGSPAKVIKYRFDKETIEKIQKIAWWDWTIDEIKKNKEIFRNELTKESLILKNE